MKLRREHAATDSCQRAINPRLALSWSLALAQRALEADRAAHCGVTAHREVRAEGRCHSAVHFSIAGRPPHYRFLFLPASITWKAPSLRSLLSHRLTAPHAAWPGPVCSGRCAEPRLAGRLRVQGHCRPCSTAGGRAALGVGPRAVPGRRRGAEGGGPGARRCSRRRGGSRSRGGRVGRRRGALRLSRLAPSRALSGGVRRAPAAPLLSSHSSVSDPPRPRRLHVSASAG